MWLQWLKEFVFRYSVIVLASFFGKCRAGRIILNFVYLVLCTLGRSYQNKLAKLLEMTIESTVLSQFQMVQIRRPVRVAKVIILGFILSAIQTYFLSLNQRMTVKYSLQF